MDNAIRLKPLALLDGHRIMTLATLRPDGWPQATTVGYVNDGLALYFLCGKDSQKRDDRRDNRVSLTIDHDTPELMAIAGLSMAAHAQPVTDRAEAEEGVQPMPAKYPEQGPLPFPYAGRQVTWRFSAWTPKVISVLNYSKGFGHTDLVMC